MKNIRFFTTGILILFLTGCGEKRSAVYKDELHIVQYQTCNNLDLHKNSALIARQIGNGTVWEKLLTLNSRDEPVPELCENFTVSADSRLFVFKLRKGVLFHNGKEMTADDVCASMNRWIESYAAIRLLTGSSRMEKIDRYTVKLSLEESCSMFPCLVAGASQPAVITTAECCSDEDSNGFMRTYIGTGPYKVAEYVPARYIKLEKFDGYVPYGKKGSPPDGLAGYKDPGIRYLYYHFADDAKAAFDDFIHGKSDVIYRISSDETAEAGQLPHITVLKIHQGTTGYVFNKKQGLASNHYFRQAVNAAMDCDALNKAAFGTLYENDSCYMEKSQNFWYTPAGSENYNRHDPADARRLLQQAGYRGEYFTIVASSLNNLDKSAILLKEELEAVGIRTKVILMDWDTLQRYREDPSGYDMFISTYAAVPVPPLKLYFSPGYAGWTDDDTLINLVRKLEQAPSKEVMKQVWQELQAYSWEYLPLVSTGHYITTYAWTDRLTGVITGDDGIYFWNAAFIK